MESAHKPVPGLEKNPVGFMIFLLSEKVGGFGFSGSSWIIVCRFW